MCVRFSIYIYRILKLLFCSQHLLVLFLLIWFLCPLEPNNIHLWSGRRVSTFFLRIYMISVSLRQIVKFGRMQGVVQFSPFGENTSSKIHQYEHFLVFFFEDARWFVFGYVPTCDPIPSTECIWPGRRAAPFIQSCSRPCARCHHRQSWETITQSFQLSNSRNLRWTVFTVVGINLSWI